MRELLAHVSFSVFFVVYIMVCAAVLIYVGLLIYALIDARIKGESKNPLIGPLSVVAFISNTVLFLPIVEVLLVQYECDSDLYLSAYPGTKCLQGSTLFMPFVSTVLLLVYIPLTLLSILMCKETRSEGGRKANGKYGIKRDVVLGILKVVVAFVYLARGTVLKCVHLSRYGRPGR